jgi:transcriptional regulator with XRE-family HTH domain
VQRFGEKLRILRKRHGMTLKELAGKTSYSTHSHISEIETGKKKPPLEFAIQVGRLFDVSLDRLLKDELEID